MELKKEGKKKEGWKKCRIQIIILCNHEILLRVLKCMWLVAIISHTKSKQNIYQETAKEREILDLIGG